MIFRDGERIVFAGDSITDMGSEQPVGIGTGDGLGQGYVRVIDNLLAAVYPDIRVEVINAGISGHTSRDLLARFDRDVLSFRPEYVSIMIGVNDVWRQFDRPTVKSGWVLPDEYRRNLTCMLTELKKQPQLKAIFLMTPYYMEPLAADKMRARMDEYGQICRELADDFDCVFIDLQALYTEYLQYRHSASIAWDRVHPNEVGATLMARAFLEKCGFDYLRQPGDPEF